MSKYEQEINQVKSCMKESMSNLDMVPKCINDLEVLIKKVNSTSNMTNIDKSLVQALDSSRIEYTLIEKFNNLAKNNEMIDPSELFKIRSHITFVQQQRQEFWRSYQEISTQKPMEEGENEYPGISVYWIIFILFIALIIKGLTDGKSGEWIQAYKDGLKLKPRDKDSDKED